MKSPKGKPQFVRQKLARLRRRYDIAILNACEAWRRCNAAQRVSNKLAADFQWAWLKAKQIKSEADRTKWRAGV